MANAAVNASGPAARRRPSAATGDGPSVQAQVPLKII